jgi:delta-1-pyrroline-5-carboxylate synthetase
MSLYSMMFNQYEVQSSQLLVTAFDFTSPERCRNVQYVISQLLSHGIVPLLNENDAVSASQGYAVYGTTFSDNDSLSSLVAIEMNAHLLVLLTDVAGVYDRPPCEEGAQLIDVFENNKTSNDVKIGDKSTQGRGGMSAKIDAAQKAIRGGVQVVVIASGFDSTTIGNIVNGGNQGTAFFRHAAVDPDAVRGRVDSLDSMGSLDHKKSITRPMSHDSSEEMAKSARSASRALQFLSSEERVNILLAIAEAIKAQTADILAENAKDMTAAKSAGIAGAMLKRLLLTTDKLDTLYLGIKSIAGQDEPLGALISRTELADGLMLDKQSCSIGVLLVIFESRPDCLPQIAALAIRSGNGLLLKGGKEASHSNALLHRIIVDAVYAASEGKVDRSVIGLVTSRADIPNLLKMDKYVDLVIPRGSGAMVQNIKDHTNIPVMGHAEGVCHIYVDEYADINKAIKIVLDSKTDYPSGCNAVETLLMHSSCQANGVADTLCRSLRQAGVVIHGGPVAVAAGLADRLVTDFHTEYGELEISIELVDSMDAAIEHIHTHGSSHTESIVTEDLPTAELFLKTVDAACVFHNASTRFADGYRFGLGAEVGISTGRIHARGPVGIEGLLTYKWQLRSSNETGHSVHDFAGKDAICHYTHEKKV